jgi:glutamyl-tRNA synthetase
LHWDEGPFFQSQRLSIYQTYVQKLLKSGHAYYCYCQKEELEKEKQRAYGMKKDWRYNRRCLHLSHAEREAKEQAHVPKAVRFLVPDHTVEFIDLVHGTVKREAQDIEDFVIMRHNNTPTYNCACVIDDYDMGVSHVIRAVEHITNTPKQILLYEALGFKKPAFAHLPLILGEDKKKLSKRHGAVSLMSYRDQGFLPEAMVNFLALLGWSPGSDKEIMKIEEITDSFSLERINPANAVFDVKKLEWMNGQYIMNLTIEELSERLKPYVVKGKLMTQDELDQRKDWFLKVCKLMQPRLRILSDFETRSKFFFSDNFEYDESALSKYCNQNIFAMIKKYLTSIDDIELFSAQTIEQHLRNFAAENNLKARDIIHPVRVFVTGQEGGPGLFETLELVGKDACLKRLKKIITESR